MRKAAFHNLGCKVNSYETEAMQQLLEDAGYEIVPFREGADVYIINTCSVTNVADRKSRQMLHRAKKMNPSAAVVAVGCYVQAAGAELKKDEAVDLIVGNNQKKDLVQILDDYFADHETAVRFWISDIRRNTKNSISAGLLTIRVPLSRYRTAATSFAAIVLYHIREDASAAAARRTSSTRCAGLRKPDTRKLS